MKYQAIIFDMDGTITDTERLWSRATEEFLAHHAIEISDQEKDALNKQFQGLSLVDVTLYLKNTFGLYEPLEQLMQEYSQYACILYETEVQFIKGFLAFHATLDNHKLKYAIATNADDLTLSATKKALSLETLFGKHIYNISHVQQGKPKPDIYLYAARQLDINPSACIAIEDSAHGIKAAKAANMFCIGINSHGNTEQLKEADIIIDAYHDIELTYLLNHQPI